MYSVKWVTLCKLTVSLVCILINNVISAQQNHQSSKPHQTPITDSTSASTNSSHIRRLMQYDDLPLGEQSEPISFPDEATDNHSLFRPPVFQEPILEPINAASVIGLSQSEDTRNNNSWSGFSLPEVPTTTTERPKNSPSNSNETKQALEQVVASSTDKSNLTTNNSNNRHLLNSTASSELLPGIGTTVNSDLQHMLRYMVSQRELQRNLKAARLLPLLVRPLPRRVFKAQSNHLGRPTFPLVRSPQLVGARQANRPLRDHDLTDAPVQPLNSFTSKIWSMFSPHWSTTQTAANEVTGFNWVYPRQVPKKRRNQLPPAVYLKPGLKMPGLRHGPPMQSLAQSASHLNSYTLDPAEDADLGSGEFIPSHEHQDPTAFHLAQQDASSQFPVELEAPSYSSGGDYLGSEYPESVVADMTADQQALLLSNFAGQPKRRRKIVKVPVSANLPGASYLHLASNSMNSDGKLAGAPPETQASTTTKEYASNPILSSQLEDSPTVEVDEAKDNKPQQVPQDDGADQQQALATSTGGRRKPTRTSHRPAPRQKRARHPSRNQLRANKNLQNFYDYGPAAGDLQPSSTFLRWKYPQLYDDNDDEGETELNIRFFNNFSRVGPLTGLGRNVATATLIISLVLLIVSNICMVATYVVHGLSALSTFYGLPPTTTTSSSASSYLARPKNVTSLSYTSWDSLFPPFIRHRTTSSTTSTTTTSTTLAPYLSSRSLLSARHYQHQQPSMTFDSEIKAFGDPWK